MLYEKSVCLTKGFAFGFCSWDLGCLVAQQAAQVPVIYDLPEEVNGIKVIKQTTDCLITSIGVVESQDNPSVSQLIDLDQRSKIRTIRESSCKIITFVVKNCNVEQRK